ncbi:MAG TPA: ABC transporter substrate-binding protein [Desulfobacterales bacterium]|nr:ABC transporter substrate-binding protein [Desulfobacterales bacterium]
MRRNVRGVCFIFMVSLLFQLQANAAAPMDAVQKQINMVLDVLRNPELKAESAKERRKERVWSIIERGFDFDELSKRILSRNWKKLNPDQQKEFSLLIGRLLGNIYMERLMKFTNEKVVFTKESMLSEKRAEVQSKIISQSKEIPLHYKMILKNGEWKVYDLKIEGVSLVRNYRSQFKKILKKNSPDKMLQILREKVGQG